MQKLQNVCDFWSWLSSSNLLYVWENHQHVTGAGCDSFLAVSCLLTQVCLFSHHSVFASSFTAYPWVSPDHSSALLNCFFLFPEPYRRQIAAPMSEVLSSLLTEFQTVFLVFVLRFVKLTKYASSHREPQTRGSWGVHVWSCTLKFLAVALFMFKKRIFSCHLNWRGAQCVLGYWKSGKY